MANSIFRSRAPLRLGLAGGGTDVAPYTDEHGGLVLNVTINKFAYATLEESDDGVVTLTNADTGVTWTGPASSQLAIHPGLELHCGVYNRIARQFAKRRLLSIKLTSHSEAPPGSGLGSSETKVCSLSAAHRNFQLGWLQ